MRNASIEQQLAAAERSFGSLSSKGCEARPYYDDIPMCRGREGGDFWDLEVLKEVPIFDVF